jgi:heat shock protein HslJ
MSRWILLALLASLPSCAGAGNRSGLADSRWQFLTIDGAAPVSPKASLSFENDRLGATVGCNGMGGPWRVEGGRLIAGPLIQTQMYCQGPIWDQERALSALLAAAPRFTVTAEHMTIRSSGHAAELRRAD